jgi:hypothetical protein
MLATHTLTAGSLFSSVGLLVFHLGLGIAKIEVTGKETKPREATKQFSGKIVSKMLDTRRILNNKQDQRPQPLWFVPRTQQS